MPSCPSAELLEAFVDRRLPSAERDEVDSHVDTCRECRTLLAEAARAGSEHGTARP